MERDKIAAVIPIKGLASAKTRLREILGPEQRALLVLSLLSHMLCVLEQAREIGPLYVVTSDAAVRRQVRAGHARVRFLADPGGINESAALAASELGASPMLFLLGDLPLLTVEDIHRAAALGRRHEVVLMPDHRHTGTNGVLLNPPGCMSTRFGPRSLRAHEEEVKRMGLTCAHLEAPGFGWDLDTPEDLRRLIWERSGKPLVKHA